MSDLFADPHAADRERFANRLAARAYQEAHEIARRIGCRDMLAKLAATAARKPTEAARLKALCIAEHGFEEPSEANMVPGNWLREWPGCAQEISRVEDGRVWTRMGRNELEQPMSLAYIIAPDDPYTFIYAVERGDG